jgi:hypothetical protein
MSLRSISETRPKARTTVCCASCQRPIGRGEVYVRQVWADSYTIWTWNQHAECAAESERLLSPGGEMPEGGLGGSYYRDEELSPEYLAWRDARWPGEVPRG